MKIIQTQNKISILQKEMFNQYRQDLSLPSAYNYYYGNPVLPIVPIETFQNGVFIIGAYPTARFATIEKVRNVPIGDINSPFSIESYFDGGSIRNVDSGEKLECNYLTPLGINRRYCWITNMVKVFLFKKQHAEKYQKLKSDSDYKNLETRSIFEKLAIDGMKWLELEIKLCNPKLVITLGNEVAGILHGINGNAKRSKLLGGDVKHVSIGSDDYKVIHFAHPGIIMKNKDWLNKHIQEHIPEAKQAIRILLKDLQ